ncbi:MAG TPA: CopD family protein [Methylomirabilota bacterium]|jgi:putative copper export protein|nr:CopD family protein [Methylomirabilota bacterium]
MELDPNVLHVAIRWLHVAAMATAFGGAMTVLALAARPGADSASAVVSVAIRYEWMFWAAAGVLAMTGIGNLAAFGAALLGPSTDWGATLLLKLGSVLALVVLSLPRTLAVARVRASTTPDSDSVTRLRNLYGASTGAFALILALAIWLAHGIAR